MKNTIKYISKMVLGLGLVAVGFQVQAHERLGVRSADIEPPILVLDANAIEQGQLPITVFLLQSRHHGLGVGHLEVQFATGEVTLDRLDQLGNRLVRSTDNIGYADRGH